MILRLIPVSFEQERESCPQDFSPALLLKADDACSVTNELNTVKNNSLHGRIETAEGSFVL